MMQVGSAVKSARISAVKITADGRRVPLGVVAYYHRSMIMRMWYSVRAWFKKGAA